MGLGIIDSRDIGIIDSEPCYVMGGMTGEKEFDRWTDQWLGYD